MQFSYISFELQFKLFIDSNKNCLKFLVVNLFKNYKILQDHLFLRNKTLGLCNLCQPKKIFILKLSKNTFN